MLSQCPLHTELGWADVLNSPSKFKNVKKYDQVYSSNLVADNQMNLGILVLLSSTLTGYHISLMFMASDILL